MSAAGTKAPRLGVADFFRIGDQFHTSALLHFAVAAKLFDDLTAPVPAAKVAASRQWSARKTEILLNAMVAAGLTEKNEERFQNTRAAGQALVSSSPDYIGAVINHQRLQWAAWGQIGAVLSDTHSLAFQQEMRLAQDPEANRAFNGAMIRLSKILSGAVVALPDFKGEKFVLDLAGGHGSYIAAIAAGHPGVRGEVWDLATTKDVSREVMEANGLASRIGFKVCDLTDRSLYDGGPIADVAMLNDCLHYFDAGTVQEIIAGAARLLKPGGTLIVLSMKLEPDGTAPAHGADFSLHMMLNTADGGLHPTAFLIETMERQGLEVQAVDLFRYALLVGRPPAG